MPVDLTLTIPGMAPLRIPEQNTASENASVVTIGPISPPIPRLDDDWIRTFVRDTNERFGPVLDALGEE